MFPCIAAHAGLLSLVNELATFQCVLAWACACHVVFTPVFLPRRKLRRIRCGEKKRGRMCKPSGRMWANPAWHSAASGAADGGLVSWLVKGKGKGGVTVRDAAESWRGAPLGLGMASVGGLESEFLAPRVTLGTVRWLLFGPPALFRWTGSSHRGWERRICWSGMICLRQRIWDRPLDADRHERERKSSVLSKLKREIKCVKQLKGDWEDYDATYFLEGGLKCRFFSLSGCCRWTVQPLEKWVRCLCESECGPTASLSEETLRQQKVRGLQTQHSLSSNDSLW